MIESTPKGMGPEPQDIKAVIFDVDGVLVDADEIHFRALNRALEGHTSAISAAEHALHYKGLPTVVKLSMLTRRRGLPQHLHTSIRQAKQRYTQEAIHQLIQPDPERVRLLQRLKAAGYRIAACSNAVRKSVEQMLRQGGYLDFCDFYLSNEDVQHCKPDPEIYQAALRRLGISPRNCLVVEDSECGRQAAVASGCWLCAVRDVRDVTENRVFQAIRYAGQMRVVIPMAGASVRFAEAGYSMPKPLIPIAGKPLIQQVVENLNLPGLHVFLCQEEHCRRYPLKQLLRALAPGCVVQTVPRLTQGAACTVLAAADYFAGQEEVLLANCDQLVDYPSTAFVDDMRSRQSDGGILTFESQSPKWSYARVADGSRRVLETREKHVISRHATVGIYYYRQGRELVRYLRRMIEKDVRVNNEFYICPAYNEYLADGKSVFIHPLPEGAMHGLGTPADLDAYLARAAPLGLTS